MSTSAQSLPSFAAPLPSAAAAFEVLGYLAAVAVATLCFVQGWLTVDGAVVATVVVLLSLIALAWFRFDRGRHPCFLFLCTLTIFQGGRLVAYCLGADLEPMRVELMGLLPFSCSHTEQGLVLLCIVLSAICVYAPCRWNYRRISPPDAQRVRPYLPYLYLVFFATLPIQLFKNYRYYEYAQQHGGYLYMYLNHAGLASSVPFLVRFVSLITFPVFLAIFVFEKRRKYLWLVTCLYLGTASVILLLGQRGAIFALAVVLWYVARMKSSRKSRVLGLLVFAWVLALTAGVIQVVRENPDNPAEIANFSATPLDFLALQGASLGVTEVAVRYRGVFAPYGFSYLWHELRNAFVPSDARTHYRGKLLPSDVSVFLNPATFNVGLGTGGSFLGEAYILAGLPGVIAISLMLGAGVHLLYRMSRRADWLLIVAMIFYDVMWMPRGELLDWFSALVRNLIALLLLAIGWRVYRFFTSIKRRPAGDPFLPAPAKA